MSPEIKLNQKEINENRESLKRKIRKQAQIGLFLNKMLMKYTRPLRSSSTIRHLVLYLV